MISLGRFTPSQATRFGQYLGATGGCGYLAIGPVAVVVSLPRWLRKPDVVLSLFDINAHLRQRAEAAVQASQD